MSDQPVTPNASSIRDFRDRTSVPPATLAESFRRNSRYPARPSSNMIADIDSNDSRNFPDFLIHSDVVTPMRKPTESSVEDIAMHLQENMQTPTKMPFASDRKAVNEELDRYIDGYTPPPRLLPAQTPQNSVSGGRQRTGSPDPRRSLLSEEFPKLSDSAKKLSSHPAYDVRTSVDRSLLKVHFNHHSTPLHDSRKSPMLDSDFVMDIDEDIDEDEANKENIDPTTGWRHDDMNTWFFETPPRAGSRSVIVTPIKQTLNQKKLAMSKGSDTIEPHTPPSANKAASSDDEMGSDAFAIPSSDDMDISGDTTLAGQVSSFFDGPTAVDIQTPSCSPTKKNQNSFPQLQHSPGLKPKFRLISTVGNLHDSAHPSALRQIDERKLARKRNIYKSSSSSPPQPPTAQKLLHKNAKERDIHTRNTEILRLRSTERLRELRIKYSNTHERGVRKMKSQSSLRKSFSAESENVIDYHEMDMIKTGEDIEFTDAGLERCNEMNPGYMEMIG
ncbi:hypothetical protein ABW21_db0206209 [Orbilia brochopaga]|nr:hypothetical protein ABW21_db0206209 [Drechslerella brochopaga]